MSARKSKIETKCAHCEGAFFVLPSRLGVRLYCSATCGKLGGNKKRSLWGKENRNDISYQQSQSERTKKSWEDEEIRERHLFAMGTPEYREMRSQNAKQIMSSKVWIDAIAEYKNSGEAKKRCATRKMPDLPNWVLYKSPNGVDHKFRSSWEETLARYFDVLGLSWKFEPRRFVLDDGSSYTPDFYVESPLGPCYIECHRLINVKPGDEEKVARLRRIVKENLLDAPLVLLDKPEIILISRLLKSKDRLRRDR